MPREVPVLHRDDHLLVVDKPAGVLVVPAAGRPEPCLVDLLTQQLGQRVFAVHRLDEDTTGCIAFALDEHSRGALEATFRDHAAVRDYLALTTAVPSPESGCIESQLEEGADGVVHALPVSRPLVLWQADPRLGAAEPSLCVGLLGIRLLNGMAG